MYRPYAGDGPEPIGVLLIPKFAAMAFFSAIEPLRVANRMAGRELFAWRSLSEDGGPVEASNGMRFMADGALAEAASMPSLIVCSSFDPQLYESKRLLAALRRLSRAGVMLGALDTGAHILAKAGLLENQTVTMHWEAVPGFREEFPEIEVSEELFEVQRGCFTCAGGTAALDMMLDMIGRKHGLALARAVSEQFIHDRIRSSSDHQRMERGVRLQITNRKALRIIDLMERNLEQPLDGPALAEAAGITPRQMERLFRELLQDSPLACYRRLRLDRARSLLRQTDLAVTEIALATGFSSASSLSRRYHEHFGLAPREDRKDRLPVRGGPGDIAVSRPSGAER